MVSNPFWFMAGATFKWVAPSPGLIATVTTSEVVDIPLVVSGRHLPATFSLLSGELPDSVVIDNDNDRLYGMISNNAYPDAEKPVWVTTSIPNSFEYTAYNYTLVANPYAGKTIASYKLINSVLPPGMLLNKSTGVLSGTILDVNGQITVNNNVTWTTPSGSLGSFVEDDAVSETLVATSSNLPMSYKVVSAFGILPNGLTLNTSTGVLSGTLYDVNGEVVTTDLPVWNTPSGSLGSYNDGDAVSLSLSVSSLKTPVTMFVKNSILPPGLVLSRTAHTISGTISDIGSIPANVNPPVWVTAANTTVLTATSEGTATGSVSATGATKYVVLNETNKLMPGAVINASTGVFSGTPKSEYDMLGVLGSSSATSLTKSFTVRAMDAGGSFADRTFQWRLDAQDTKMLFNFEEWRLESNFQPIDDYGINLVNFTSISNRAGSAKFGAYSYYSDVTNAIFSRPINLNGVSCTYSTWMRVDSADWYTGIDEECVILDYGNRRGQLTGFNQGFQVSVYIQGDTGGSNQAQFKVYVGSSNIVPAYTSPVFTFASGTTWKHIEVGFDNATNTWYFFQDGALVSTDVRTYTALTNKVIAVGPTGESGYNGRFYLDSLFLRQGLVNTVGFTPPTTAYTV